MTLRDIDRPYWDAACRQLVEKLDREIMTKKPNPLHVEVIQHAEPYVALVLYAAQTFEAKDPQFARQLEEAARYFDHRMAGRMCVGCGHVPHQVKACGWTFRHGVKVLGTCTCPVQSGAVTT